MLLFIVAIGCAISSSIVISDMIEEINRVTPTDEKENPLFGYPGKIGRIERKYRQLNPDGSREELLDRLMIMSGVLLVVGAGLMFGPGFL